MRRPVRFAAAGAAVLIVLTSAVSLGRALPPGASRSAPAGHQLAQDKGDPDAAGGTFKDAIGPNERRGPDASPGIEDYLNRAYPASEVPVEATIAAQQGFAALRAQGASPGTWQLIGPSRATYPGVLNTLGDGAQYVTAGRVTALALAPGCSQGACRLYAAAAGGGIWRTTKALSGSQGWEFVSGSFATGAIGSLVIDPNDPSGLTLYAGTGEPNVSIDSEAGMGIYRTTDGGDTWTLLPGSSKFQGRAVASIAIQPDGTILAGVARGVRGVSSVTSGGVTSNNPPFTQVGVYRSPDGGATFSDVLPAPGSPRGVNQVGVDPDNPRVLYASLLGNGVWRSTDDGATWAQIKAALNPAINFDRSEFALAGLAGGVTRMYLGQGNAHAPDARFFRTDDAAGAAAFTDLTTSQVANYCTGQCWYDNAVYTPAGHPEIVYVLGSFDYGQDHNVSNARAVLLSTDAGATWSDMTKDGAPHNAGSIHPDQHALVTVPGNPFLFFDGSDGGVVRSDGSLVDVSSQCDQRGLDAAGTAYCKSLLGRVPGNIASLNPGLSTLQFQSLSASPKRPQNNVQGGTQDNGTFQYTGSSDVWFQEIFGDGGQSGFSAADDGLRFNTFTGQSTDVNFRDGQPTKWVVATGPIVSSPEGSYFYPPVTGDPNPANGGTIFQGSQSIWRTQDWGGNRDFLEANCPEFTTQSSNPSCGDFVRIGPAGKTDLTAATYGSRAGGFVAAIVRAPGNTGTLWAATGTGRVFLSDDSDAAAASVAYTRLDSLAANSPGRFVSSIAVAPDDPHHAWVSYSGYNFNTPAQPGHVFEVTSSGGTATWVDRSYNLPNLPVTGLARDDVTGDLYAASDFGVMRLASGSTTWTVAGAGMPMVEVAGLTIVPSQRILYAATHGRSAWRLDLP